MPAASGNATLATAAAQPKGVSTRTRAASHNAARAASTRPRRSRLIDPVSAGGEEEADDHRQGEAEQHLVRMPDRPGEVGMAEDARELQRPQRNRQRGERAREQVERPEAELPEREARRRRPARLVNEVQRSHAGARGQCGGSSAALACGSQWRAATSCDFTRLTKAGSASPSCESCAPTMRPSASSRISAVEWLNSPLASAPVLDAEHGRELAHARRVGARQRPARAVEMALVGRALAAPRRCRAPGSKLTSSTLELLALARRSSLALGVADGLDQHRADELARAVEHADEHRRAARGPRGWNARPSWSVSATGSW